MATNGGNKMVHGWIGRAPTKTLQEMLQDEDSIILQEILDEAAEELQMRHHDLEDPSSGLGCHA
jgi:hypothetical protein